MRLSPISLIIIVEGVREDVRFHSEELIHDYMTSGPNRQFDLLVNLPYLRVYRNLQPGYREDTTYAYVITDGLVQTTYKPVTD